MPWTVYLHPAAEEELNRLPQREKAAIDNAIEKLEQIGSVLGYPHSSAIRDAAGNLRELRPRGGRSPWRAFYRQVGSVFVIGAVGPEAQVKPRLSQSAVAAAQQRIDEVKDDS